MRGKARGVLVDRFLAAYPYRLGLLRELADTAEAMAREALWPLNLDLHLISARCKDPRSVVAKIRRKGYGNPSRQLTDAVGLRVICYYGEDVDRAAGALRQAFEIDEKRSIDKRNDLQLRQFGYRSVHLIARCRADSTLGREEISKIWFEIQVRSILEHAWAEIEHEISYKSGVRFPDPLLRRFGGIAGTLEILDQQFAALRKSGDEYIDELRDAFAAGRGFAEQLDTARLVALLEVIRPEGLGWRAVEHGHRRFRPSTAPACVEALAASGIETAQRLVNVLQAKRCRALTRAFAGRNGIEPQRVSHLALSILAVMAIREGTLRRYPDLTGDPSVSALLVS